MSSAALKMYIYYMYSSSIIFSRCIIYLRKSNRYSNRAPLEKKPNLTQCSIDMYIRRLHSYIQKERERDFILAFQKRMYLHSGHAVFIPVLQTFSLPLRMLYLQRGHVAFIRSHLPMHSAW